MYDTGHDFPVDLRFNLDELALSDWEDREPDVKADPFEDSVRTMFLPHLAIGSRFS
jgi:hypothetical protein